MKFHEYFVWKRLFRKCLRMMSVYKMHDFIVYTLHYRNSQTYNSEYEGTQAFVREAAKKVLF